jgi:dihydropyrimidinase
VRGIRNALLVAPDGVTRGSLVFEGGVIQAVGADSLLAPGDDVLDAGGRFVLPGLVDAQAHLGAGGPAADAVEEQSRLAAAAGVTTWNLVQPAGSLRSDGEGALPEAVAAFVELAEARSHCHFSLTPVLTTLEEAALVGALADEWGVTSFALQMDLRGGWRPTDWAPVPVPGLEPFDDAVVYSAMRAVGRLRPPGLMNMHCENVEIARELEAELAAAGRSGPDAWGQASPGYLEAMDVQTYGYLAPRLGAPLLVQQATAPETFAALRRAKDRGQAVHGQTAVHHLVLDEGAARTRVPLRPAAERELRWRALAHGTVDCVASLHAGPLPERAGARDGGDELPGFPSRVEVHLPLLLSEGVRRGRLSLERLCAVACANPARLLGLWPRKGAIRPGSDADLVVLDLDARRRIEPEFLPGAPAWTPYEGMEVTGWPLLTLLGGEVVAEWRPTGAWTSGEPRGGYLRRQPAAG